MLVTSVVDPDQNWIRIQQLFGSGSNLDPLSAALYIRTHRIKIGKNVSTLIQQ